VRSNYRLLTGEAEICNPSPVSIKQNQ